MIAQTPTGRPAGIMAARLMDGDVVEFNGIEGTVEEVHLEAGRLVLTLTDGNTYRINPCQIVTAII